MLKIGNSGVKNKPYRVETGGYLILSNGDKMYVPKDYFFDNGSIPKPFKFLFDTFGWSFLNYKYTAFLIHDYLYNFKGYRTSPAYVHQAITRAEADKEMAYWMKLHGDSRLKIYTYYIFVRLFGWLFYGKL